MSSKKDSNRRLAYVVALSGGYHRSYGCAVVPLSHARIYSTKGSANSAKNHIQRRYFRYAAVDVVECELVPTGGLSPAPASPTERYKLVSDESGHKFAIPVAMEDEWDVWAALPANDPLSWKPPPFAIRIDGNFTFTDPRS